MRKPLNRNQPGAPGINKNENKITLKVLQVGYPRQSNNNMKVPTIINMKKEYNTFIEKYKNSSSANPGSNKYNDKYKFLISAYKNKEMVGYLFGVQKNTNLLSIHLK